MGTPSPSRSPRLVDVVIPRRGAASRASANFSIQLESSPIASSDAEHFGEPMRGKDRSRVKVKYGGRSGSSRSSGNTNSTKSGSARRPVPSTTTKPVAAPPAPSSSRPSRSTGRKRRLSESYLSVSDREDGFSSSLTPLSSPTKSISTPRSSMRTPVKKVGGATTLRGREIATTLSARTRKTTAPLATPRHAISSPALGSRANMTLTPMSSLSALMGGKSGGKKLGIFVWVLVDMKGNVVEDDYRDDDENAPQRMWWPGLKTKERPLQIVLYGSVNSGTGSLTVDVPDPSERNIRDADNSCFTASTFLISSRNELPVTASPTKKQKTDIVSLWHNAVNQMNEDQAENRDANVFEDSPTKAETPSGKLKARPRAKGAKGKGGKGKAWSDDEDIDLPIDNDNARDDFWVPPPVDESLNIGEEKVFAREKKTSSLYWPAFVQYYKQPKNAKEEPLYGVKFLDEVKTEIPRSWFFTSDQDEFATCKLGKWKSSIIEVVKDGDDANEDIDESSRAPSPEAILPAPDPNNFYYLSIHEQLAYVKPVLAAILNEGYKPARRRHLDFIKGGSARTRTQESAASRGTMSPDDVGTLQKCMMRWVLREEQGVGENLYKDLEETTEEQRVEEERNPGITNTVGDFESPLSSSPLEIHAPSSPPPDGPPSSFSVVCAENDQSTRSPQVPGSAIVRPPRPPRQVGCEGYEGLARNEKIGYCLNVLLPEAIRQMLLWREGKRTSFELLSDAEEEELYKVGEEMLQKTDWVYDTMRMRESRLRILTKGAETVGGTRSRPRKRSGRHH